MWRSEFVIRSELERVEAAEDRLLGNADVKPEARQFDFTVFSGKVFAQIFAQIPLFRMEDKRGVLNLSVLVESVSELRKRPGA